MASYSFEITVNGANVRTATITKTGTSGGYIDGETVSNGQTDFQIVANVDVSATKFFYIKSDQSVTLETNNGAAPDDTLSLVANEPYMWWNGNLDAFKLGTDVTSFYITNASGSTATIYAEWLTDATP